MNTSWSPLIPAFLKKEMLWQCISRKFADACEETNPAFDRSLFLQKLNAL